MEQNEETNSQAADWLVANLYQPCDAADSIVGFHEGGCECSMIGFYTLEVNAHWQQALH